MSIVRRLGIPILLTMSLIVISTAASATPTEQRVGRCVRLSADDFSGIPDAPTEVISAKIVDVNDDHVTYCEVRGYVSPSIGFLLVLPTENWNFKFLEFGCGGSCGLASGIGSRDSPPLPSACAEPLRRGYACIVSDGGNQSTGADMKWAFDNPRSVIDNWVTSPHVVALSGKAIARRYYETPPRRSYFMGCSTGGAQAFSEAQRFPWDFDGIVAGSPSDLASASLLRDLWSTRAITGPDGDPILSRADLVFLHESVVAACDMDDGVKDGLIGDPRACRFNPTTLRCTGEKNDRCLTARQVQAILKIYGGPTTSQGRQIVPSSVMKGSELNWLDQLTPEGLGKYVADWFRYYYLQPNPGPTWKAEDFDFDVDFKRLGIGDIIEPTNPDLRRFRAAGGKLLIYGGWNDSIGGALNPVDYYEMVEKIVGDRTAAQDFVRLFMIPGMDHCSGGDGAYSIDWLTYLDAWSDEGRAPAKVVGYHPQPDPSGRLSLTNIGFSRPVYPYPLETRYSGRGDPTAASSFGPSVNER